MFVVLIILDGWGVAPPSKGNGITLAHKPCFDQLVQNYPHCLLNTSEETVGLSWGELGGSEVGHLSIGAGKIVYQDLPKINKAIFDKTFFKNDAFHQVINHVKKNKSSLHLIGLLSSGGVHSLHEHLYALLELCKKEKLARVFIHVFTDGRDVPNQSGLRFTEALEEKIKELKIGKISTIIGRYFAMDRNNHWERTEKTYQLLTEGKGEIKKTSKEAIENSYQEKIFDEFIEPKLINEKLNVNKEQLIKDNDGVIFFNFRSDRARQLTKAFILENFQIPNEMIPMTIGTDEVKFFKFKRKYLKNLFFVSMTEYEKNLPVQVAFSSEKVEKPLAKIISENNLFQLHLAETEKYAHVTYFFNGKKEEVFPREKDILIPSPLVATFDLKPEMSAFQITEKAITEIISQKYDFILINFANPDMIGHTGKLEAVIKAIQTIDEYLGKIIKVILEKKGVCLITADHGNAEQMIDSNTNLPHTNHTLNPVPFILIGEQWKISSKEYYESDIALARTKPMGILADISPTILEILNLPIPPEMTGMSLLGTLTNS